MVDKLVASVEPAPSPPQTPKRKRGGQSRFTSQLAKRVYDLAVKGLTAEQISRDIGVSVHALNNWKGAQAHFAEAVKTGRRVADELVVASLFQRATGYSHPAVKVFYCKERGIVTHEYTEHYAPDTTACIFWLKNRMRSKWSDATEFHGSMAATIQTGEIEALATRLEQILRDTNGSNSTIGNDSVAAVVEASVQASDGGGAPDAPHDPSLPASAAEGLLANEGKDGGLARSE